LNPKEPVVGVTGLVAVVQTKNFDAAEVRVSVITPAPIEVAPAATETVAKEIELLGVAGATGEPAGVPASTVKVTLLFKPL
jgi:hypothetical protein